MPLIASNRLSLPLIAPNCLQLPLKVRRGFWRWRNDVADLRRCKGPQRDRACSGGPGRLDVCSDPRVQTTANFSLACTSQYCSDGLAGPYCTACADEDHYYIQRLATCRACGMTYAEAYDIATTLFLGLAGGLLLLLTLYNTKSVKTRAVRFIDNAVVRSKALLDVLKTARSLVQKLDARVRRAKINVYYKDLVRFVQVVINLEAVYAQQFPTSFAATSDWLRGIFTLSIFAPPMECFGLGGHFYTVTPRGARAPPAPCALAAPLLSAPLLTAPPPSPRLADAGAPLCVASVCHLRNGGARHGARARRPRRRPRAPLAPLLEPPPRREPPAQCELRPRKG